MVSVNEVWVRTNGSVGLKPFSTFSMSLKAEFKKISLVVSQPVVILIFNAWSLFRPLTYKAEPKGLLSLTYIGYGVSNLIPVIPICH